MDNLEESTASSVFKTGETKIQFNQPEKRRKDAALLEKANKPSGVMVWMEMSSQGLTKPYFCAESKAKIDATHCRVRYVQCDNPPLLLRVEQSTLTSHPVRSVRLKDTRENTQTDVRHAKL
ncbi:hypothetical protein TNCV_2849011 [Trichonephila clavipes]|nr:hypothetical protein TNCV_2849011 [Trichonephila clavipes]